MSSGSPARVLICVLVYNGREVIEACLSSLSRLPQEPHEVDVVILDDCSPEPGFSDAVREDAERRGFGYYRSPRNLGIPRNMNLGLLKALTDDYDYALLLNSDVLVPANLVSGLVAAARSRDSIASVTAWSNNVSIFSIPNDGTDQRLATPEWTDWVSSSLEARFADKTVAIPTGVGFCLFVPTALVRDVGLFDPVFGRGYCEEVDWCLRAKELGLENVLALGVYVFHEGNVSTRASGLLEHGSTTVWEHEAIVDMRHPQYRRMLERFEEDGTLQRALADATEHLVHHGAQTRGYEIVASWIRRFVANPDLASFRIAPGGAPLVAVGSFLGFTTSVTLESSRDVVEQLTDYVGRDPEHVGVFDRGVVAEHLLDVAKVRGVTTKDLRSYPERV